VNNSIFHQIAEQLQQQNLEHLRQQLLEQQQPQKVHNPTLWSLALLLSVFCKLAFLCGCWLCLFISDLNIFSSVTVFASHFISFLKYGGIQLFITIQISLFL
jgi:hypothetical protein